MSNSVTLRLNIKETERALRLLKERARPAIARALNRSNLAMRTFMTKQIAPEIRLKSADVKAALVASDATPTNLKATLSTTMKRIPLIKFNARGPEPSRGRGRGVTARTPAGRYPNAFIATLKSGRRGVFTRIGAMGRGASGPSFSQRKSEGAWSPNLPIKELMGPSTGFVFRKFADQGLNHGLEALNKNLRSELKFALSQS